MYTPKIKEDLIPILYKKAKEVKKPMTRLIDELLRPLLIKDEVVKDEVLIKSICASCKSEIDADDGQHEAFCEKCEAIVALERKAS